MRQFCYRILLNRFSIAGVVSNYFIVGLLSRTMDGNNKKYRQQNFFHTNCSEYLAVLYSQVCLRISFYPTLGRTACNNSLMIINPAALSLLYS